MESDSSNINQTLTCRYEPDVQTQVIADDILELIQGLGKTSISFVKRDANHVAHFLSHFCPNEGDDFLWVGNVPEKCKVLMVNDVRRESIIQ